ncbi:hypothetical protein [Deinococcus aerius]|uniref:hypothetical protein n=1 Tax=Deinococcus aerius TaxID=200253 RepID=UPI0010575CEF|nr:hypothetical protein [Deinococcus aerius]
MLVIVAPPGSKKSGAMYQTVQDIILDRNSRLLPRTRLLWATHGTKDEKSLGQEAKGRLHRLLDPKLNLFARDLFEKPWEVVTVLHGWDYCEEKNINYHEQFDGARSSVVTVISQAHLPLVLSNPSDPRFKKLLEDVGLIVVDEDPVGSLIYTLKGPNTTASPVTPEFLEVREAAGTASNIELALLRLMRRAQGGEFDDVAEQVVNGRWKTVLFSLTARSFWTALSDELIGVSPGFSLFGEAIENAITDARSAVPGDFYRLFEEDLLSPEKTSARFGLTWIRNRQGNVVQMRFRGDVLRVIPGDTPPIVILDAYASQELQQYERMFPNHRVRYIAEWPFTPLDIEYADDEDDEEAIEVDRKNMANGKQVKLRNYLMAETGELTRGHAAGTLVLSYSEVTDFLAEKAPAQRWSWRFEPPLPDDAIKLRWWFSGRGINAFDGRHVVAWHAPRRPKTYELHTLAALAPYCPEERKQLNAHAFRSELLQMLHRGRQTNYPPGETIRPRVVLFFNPGDLPKEWASCRKFTPRLKFKRYSKNPLHEAAVQVLAGELLELYGGVPHACLAGLGLYVPKPQERALWSLAEPNLRRALTTPMASSVAPVLTEWLVNPAVLQHRLGEYSPADGTHTQLVVEILRAADCSHLHTLKKFDVPVPSRLGTSTTRVYARSQVEAEKALSQVLK